jgi:hypothetical protein
MTALRTRHLLLLVPALLGAAIPAASADSDLPTCRAEALGSPTETALLPETETLTVQLGRAPATVRAGTGTAVPVTVRRGTLPAAGVEVYGTLRHGGSSFDGASSATVRTDAAGRAVLHLAVPKDSRQALQVTADAWHELAELPCHNAVGERGSAAASWGRSVA